MLGRLTGLKGRRKEKTERNRTQEVVVMKSISTRFIELSAYMTCQAEDPSDSFSHAPLSHTYFPAPPSLPPNLPASQISSLHCLIRFLSFLFFPHLMLLIYSFAA